MKKRTLVATSILCGLALAPVACERSSDSPSAIAQRSASSQAHVSKSPPRFLSASPARKRPTARRPALGAGAGAATSASPIPARYQAFAAKFDLERTTHGAPGAAVALIEHGEVTFTHGFGTAGPNSTQPVDAQTIFRVGTTTEALTAATQLALIDRGKASLGESITDLVPGVALSGTNASALTLRDLLSHQSGLLDFTLLSSDQTLTTNSCATDPSTLGSFVTGSQFELNELFMNAPGLFYTPVNPNYILAGAAIEKESGAFFADAMKAVLFAPLGMTRTFFLPADVTAAGNYSDGLSTNLDGTPWDVAPGDYDCAAYRPYGYAFSTAADYAKFLQLLLVGDTQVLSERSRHAMQSAQIGTGDLGKISSEGYGLTVQTGYVSPTNAYYATKAVSSVGALPGFTSQIYFFPETGFGFVALSNTDGAAYSTSLDAAIQSFAGLPPASPLPPSSNAVPAKFASYAGTYLDLTGELGTIVVSEQGGALTVALPDAAGFGFTYWPTLTPALHDGFLIALDGYATPMTFIPDSRGAYDYLLIADQIPAVRMRPDGGP